MSSSTVAPFLGESSSAIEMGDYGFIWDKIVLSGKLYLDGRTALLPRCRIALREHDSRRGQDRHMKISHRSNKKMAATGDNLQVAHSKVADVNRSEHRSSPTTSQL